MSNEDKIKDMSPEEFKNLKLEFAPGCFDHFEGTQEELDDLINQIKEMFASGEAQQLAQPLDFEDLEDEDFEILNQLDAQDKRTLQ